MGSQNTKDELKDEEEEAPEAPPSKPEKRKREKDETKEEYSPKRRKSDIPEPTTPKRKSSVSHVDSLVLTRKRLSVSGGGPNKAKIVVEEEVPSPDLTPERESLPVDSLILNRQRLSRILSTSDEPPSFNLNPIHEDKPDETEKFTTPASQKIRVVTTTIDNPRYGEFKSTISDQRFVISTDNSYVWINPTNGHEEKMKTAAKFFNPNAFFVKLDCSISDEDKKTRDFFYYYSPEEHKWTEIFQCENSPTSPTKDMNKFQNLDGVKNRVTHFHVQTVEGYFYYFKVDKESGESDRYYEVFGGYSCTHFKKVY